MRKLNVSWNPMAKEAMEKPTAIDEEQSEKTKQVHFVFNTELSSGCVKGINHCQVLVHRVQLDFASFWLPRRLTASVCNG
jgi:Na+-translocating ferredoxin:NAD+ oxidoreductase RNF subunit RnfB